MISSEFGQARVSPAWGSPRATGPAGMQKASGLPVIAFGAQETPDRQKLLEKLHPFLRRWESVAQRLADSRSDAVLTPEHLIVAMAEEAKQAVQRQAYERKVRGLPLREVEESQLSALLTLIPEAQLSAIRDNSELARLEYLRQEGLPKPLRTGGMGRFFTNMLHALTFNVFRQLRVKPFNSALVSLLKTLDNTDPSQPNGRQALLEKLQGAAGDTMKMMLPDIADPRNQFRVVGRFRNARVFLIVDEETQRTMNAMKEQLRQIRQTPGNVMSDAQYELIAKEIEKLRSRSIIASLGKAPDMERLNYLLTSVPWARKRPSLATLTGGVGQSASWQDQAQGFHKRARAILDTEHEGMDDTKTKLINLMYKQLWLLHQAELGNDPNPKTPGTNMLFVGPPGVGKTSIARGVATALGRDYAEISLSNITHRGDLSGHSKTFMGAMAGEIIKALERAGSTNPVILLDEVDKLSSNAGQWGGNPMEALLQALEEEGRKRFADNYLGMSFDLSEVIFILTANDASRLSEPILNRVDLVKVPGYDARTKLKIARNHMIPKIIVDNQLVKPNGTSSVSHTDSAVAQLTKQIFPDDKALFELIETTTNEWGVRELKQRLEGLVQAWNLKQTIDTAAPKTITLDNLPYWLKAANIKPSPLHKPQASQTSRIGRVNALWVSEMSSGMAYQDAVVHKYKLPFQAGTYLPQIVFETGFPTSNMKDMSQVSALRALDWYNRTAPFLGLAFPKISYHPALGYLTEHWRVALTPQQEGDVDGPSAGAAMTTLLVSAMNDLPVKGDVAMTGTITLQGEVGAVGGVREKVIGAAQAKAKTIIIPKENAADLMDLPEWVYSDPNSPLERIVLADSIYDVLKTALEIKSGSRFMQRLNLVDQTPPKTFEMSAYRNNPAAFKRELGTYLGQDYRTFIQGNRTSDANATRLREQWEARLDEEAKALWKAYERFTDYTQPPSPVSGTETPPVVPRQLTENEVKNAWKQPALKFGAQPTNRPPLRLDA